MEYHSKYTGAEVDALLGKVESGDVGGKVTVDSALSTTSENPVMNKVITEELRKKLEGEVVGTTSPTEGTVGGSYDDTEIKQQIAELSEEIDSKLTENGIGEKSVTLAAGPTYTKAYFENPLPIGTKIKSISFNGVASWFYWVNGQGTLFTDAQLSSASAPLTLDKEVYGVATPGDTATDVTIVYETIVPTDKLARMDEDITQLKEEVKEIAEAVGAMPEGKSVAEIVTETYEEIKTIEVDTPASYYGRVLFDEPILAGTLIKSIEIVGDVTWFYWANGIGSMFTDAQISAASAPMVLDKDVYGVAAPSSTSAHVKIVTSMGEKTIDKVARIDEDVQILQSGKKWEGKTIVAFGDSITHFIGTDQKTYSDHLAEITGANVINCGIGGSTYRQRATPEDSTTNENTARAALDIVNMVKAAITQNFTAQVNAAALITTHQPYTLDYEVQVNNLVGVDWSKVDAVIFFGGTNDFANVGQLLGEDNSTSLSETKGALNYILTEFCKTYPKVKINFLTPIVRYVDPPQFSTSKQYNVGDVTMYQGGRYKFINAHSGAWNTADVQTITSYEARVDATWGDNYKNAGDMTLREYGEALGAFVKKVYHIVPIDMYNIGWNRVNFDNYFVNTDATHPLSGFKALAEVMAKKLDL